ncbi:MAG: phosphoenolpyruvate carboxykinase (GTP) [Candidatus Omnitrophota bacterium]
MTEDNMKILEKKCGKENFKKLTDIKSPGLHRFIAECTELCNPASVFVRTDAPEDIEYIRQKALVNGEERSLKIKGHSIHFDGYNDQGRDKSNTKYLLRPDEVLGSDIKSEDREKGLNEIRALFKNAMAGKEMYVCFFCLGPVDSAFSIPAVQVTDSAYVAHSEDILYRNGYEQFQKAGTAVKFFRFLHSAGVLKDGVSSDVANRRVYIDLEEETVHSINTQYAGNTVGLKKLAMRLAIKRASEDGWLTEHMFVMGVKGPQGKRVTYFTGSFPSACGKTATAMLEDEKIIGDDIAYLRRIGTEIRAVNVERGIFGIIRDVNEKNDPSIYEALTVPGEVIFSNVLVDENNNPRWLSDSRPDPEKGINFSGKWQPGKKGPDNKEVDAAHKNARYTIRLEDLKNCDDNLENPAGVKIGAVIYGGRDSDTSVPVNQSFDWAHGILTQGATIESETTAATLGTEGVRTFNLMANLDFLSIPIGRYIQNNLDIVKGMEDPPLIFCVNYFLKGKDGKYLNGITDKHVWLKWMELRVNDEKDAIKTPIGYIPAYSDLAELFKKVLNKDYSSEEYEDQFKLRIPENIAKIGRIRKIYHAKVFDTPHILMKALDDQEKRLIECRREHGDYVLPSVFEKDQK